MALEPTVDDRLSTHYDVPPIERTGIVDKWANAADAAQLQRENDLRLSKSHDENARLALAKQVELRTKHDVATYYTRRSKMRLAGFAAADANARWRAARQNLVVLQSPQSLARLEEFRKAGFDVPVTELAARERAAALEADLRIEKDRLAVAFRELSQALGPVESYLRAAGVEIEDTR